VQRLRGSYEIMPLVCGAFVLYLALTAWMTVRRRHVIGYFEFFALLVALCIVASSVGAGLTDGGLNAGSDFMLACIAALAAGGDLRLLIHRGICGRQRSTRHLWRLCAALLIGTATLIALRGPLFLSLLELAILAAWVLRSIHLRRSTSHCGGPAALR
jgi:uncharacterized membrane protein